MNDFSSSDSARFAAIYQREHSDVLRFIARRLNPPDLARAEDVAHETFLVAWRRLTEIPVNLNEARAWLFTVARNCLLNELRKGSKRAQLNVRIADTAADAAAFSEPDAIGAKLDLTAAWNRLDAGDQEVIALNYWDGLSSAEAAKVLGITGPNYRIKLHRARNNLKKLLEG